ncbi:MAG TPA: DUF2203 domain-containing protein [Thermoplasmata archaeon]|nr:DUF2203 domain-containing protein [Thermoplasmata archaeon]
MERSGDTPQDGPGPTPRPRRLWTVDEATERLPAIREKVRELRGWVSRLRAIHPELERLASFWGKEIDSADHPDKALKDRLEAESAMLTQRLEREILGLHEEGIELKDIDAGLLDFFSEIDGEVVCLCWRDGEEEIGFYHTLIGGFRGRKPLRRRPTRANRPAHEAP